MVTMVTNVYSFLASGGGEGSPPMGRVPYPVKHQSFGVKNGQSNSFEKRALIRENNKFEKLVEKKQQLKVIPEIKIKLASFNSITLSLSLSLFPLSHSLSFSESVELRRKQRTERQIRLQNKINKMQSNLRTQEILDTMMPWLLVGVAIVVVGYLVYCYYTKT